MHHRINLFFGLPKNFKLACLRESKRVHAFYKKISTPVHCSYFAAATLTEHAILAWLSGILFIIVAVGWIIEEKGGIP